MLMELARSAAARLGRGEVVVAPIGGGVAVHTGHGTPANKLAGLGFGDVPPPAELEAIENAFALRHSPLQVEFASLGDPVVPRMLSGSATGSSDSRTCSVCRSMSRNSKTETERSRWNAQRPKTRIPGWTRWRPAFSTRTHSTALQSHQSFSRDVIEQIFGDTFTSPSFERFIARRDGAVAGGASLRTHEGIAQLAGAATLRDHRRQGVQRPLLRHRLLDAARRGCDVAVVTTQPGSKSTENVQRFGFSVLYVRAILVKEHA